MVVMSHLSNGTSQAATTKSEMAAASDSHSPVKRSTVYGSPSPERTRPTSALGSRRAPSPDIEAVGESPFRERPGSAVPWLRDEGGPAADEDIMIVREAKCAP